MRTYKSDICEYRGIELRIRYCISNERDIRNGHKKYVLKLEDSIRYESNSKEEIDRKYISNGDADNYCVWRRMLPLDKDLVVCKYLFTDFNNILLEALKSTTIGLSSKEAKYIMRFFRIYNKGTQERSEEERVEFEVLKCDNYFLRVLQEFSNQYFIKM